jgi:hypothetical protein
MGKGKGRLLLFVVVILLCLGLGSAGAIVWGLSGVADEIRAAPGFATGWARASASPLLTEALGPPQLAQFNLVEFVKRQQPWAFTSSFTTRTQTTSDGVRTIREERNEIEVPIEGPRGVGSLKMETMESEGAWEVKKLSARLQGRPGELNLLEQGP